jgi:cytochrome c-type biogenesis protein CcmH/NrfF
MNPFLQVIGMLLLLLPTGILVAVLVVVVRGFRRTSAELVELKSRDRNRANHVEED